MTFQENHQHPSELLQVLRQIAIALESIQKSHKRIASHLAPEPAEIVDTPYLANILGCTKVWIAQMVRQGKIPKSCIVAGTGNGKPWKFYRRHIETWLETR